MFDYQKTELWLSALGARSDDAESEGRERLRVALSTMRERVGILVQRITAELPELTVHDLTHLDALWGTASTIAGNQLSLNPAEAFVFGAAVLLHDAALSAAAYPGGIEALKSTIEWQDTAAEFEIRSDRDQTTSTDPTALERHILFLVLRRLHAAQAEQLPNLTFPKPKSDEVLYLLQDDQLREAFASSIGRIAHSHHWDVRDLPERLRSTFGSAPGLPAEWTINEVKVACLLRCADAAHLDSRRAPSFLYSLIKPSGSSDDHWAFQNHLNQVALTGDRLVYTAGKPFKTSETQAWWLCFDTLRMVDFELKSSSAILSDINAGDLAAKGVAGIESPRLLERYVRVEGWRPVDAEVKVSDPVHLARTLGGRNLYGVGILPPIRELLQNSVDAIRARRNLEQKDCSLGLIELKLKKSGDHYKLTLTDNGIGMSERVLCGPLIDFGKSFWTSELAQEEFPGLISSRPRTVGKFGIGFFSAFLASESVRVSSRRYDAARADKLTLLFEQLDRRPIVRAATTKELPGDFSTQIELLIDQKLLSKDRDPPDPNPIKSLVAAIRQMIAALDVEVLIEIDEPQTSHHHVAHWSDTPAADFLDDLYGEEPRLTIKRADAIERLRCIVDENAAVLGRAVMVISDDRYRRESSFLSVGGLTTRGVGGRRGFRSHLDIAPIAMGVLNATTDDVSRESAQVQLPSKAVDSWLLEQITLLDATKYSVQSLMAVAHEIILAGRDSRTLPVAMHGGAVVDLQKFRQKVIQTKKIVVPLKVANYDKSVSPLSFGDLHPDMFLSPVNEDVAVCSAEGYSSLELGSEKSRQELIDGSRVELTSDELASISEWPFMRLLRLMLRDVVDTSKQDFKLQHAKMFSAQVIGAMNRRFSLIIQY